MELALPIKFYQQPRMLVFFAILCMIGLVFFGYDLIYPIDTHRGELPILIKIIIIIFCIGWDVILLKQLIDKKPLFTLNKQHISITQWFKEDIIIAYQDIEAIHISHDRHPRIVFERHNSKLFENQPAIPIGFLQINNQAVNTRQIEDVINQVFDNYKNTSHQVIYLNTIKQHFFDGY